MTPERIEELRMGMGEAASGDEMDALLDAYEEQERLHAELFVTYERWKDLRAALIGDVPHYDAGPDFDCMCVGCIVDRALAAVKEQP